MRRIALLVTLIAALAPIAHATLTDPLQNDADSGGDAGDSPQTATKLVNPEQPRTSDGTYTGQVYVGDDPDDWYVFEMHAAGPIRVIAKVKSPQCTPALPLGGVSPPSQTPFEIALVDPFMHVVGSIRGPSPCDMPNTPIDAGAPTNGTWRIQAHYAIPMGPPTGGSHMRLQATQADPHTTTATVEADYELTLTCKPAC